MPYKKKINFAYIRNCMNKVYGYLDNTVQHSSPDVHNKNLHKKNKVQKRRKAKKLAKRNS